MTGGLVGRYLAREIVRGVLFVLFGFLALFAFFDLVNELDDLGRGGYRLQHAIAYVVLTLPSHTYELMPIAALIGAVYALAQFASHSEFTAMRAAGMGRKIALRGVVAAGAAFAVMTALIGEAVAPPADRLAQSVRLSAIGAAVAGQFRSGMWIKDTQRAPDGTPQRLRFVNIGSLKPDGTLERVQIFEFDPDFTLRSVIRADRALVDDGTHWRLFAIEETRFISGRTADDVPTLQSRIVRDDEREWPSEIGPDIVRVAMLEPDRMSLWALVQYTRHLKENRQSAERYEIALWKKVVYPLAVVVMMALALPFGYLQVRAGSIGYKVFAGIMLGIAFHFMNGLFSHLGLLNTWPAWLSTSLPSLVAAAVAMIMLARVGSMR
ncbi:MAG TPA: LPS export ABC transporter permease LptG [Burkholderiaceae bacterium]|nr:LPS export ABC transporter permease LptG [Burkholderiaceae bacterium]